MTTSVESLKYLRDLVHRRSAIVIEADKDDLLESRLVPLAKQHSLASIDELVKKVRLDERAALSHAVIEAMTTNETSFFRDAHPFEALRTKILPDLVAARSASRTLNIWCAAASTGQEPYSIAMAIREAFPALAAWNVRIVATDLNATVLARARLQCTKRLRIAIPTGYSLVMKCEDLPAIDKAIEQLEYTKGWVEERVRAGLTRGESPATIAADVGHAVEHAVDNLKEFRETMDLSAP